MINNMMQPQFHFFVIFFYRLTSAKTRNKKIRLQDLKIYLQALTSPATAPEKSFVDGM